MKTDEHVSTALQRHPPRKKSSKLWSILSVLASQVRHDVWRHLAQLPLGGLSMCVPKTQLAQQKPGLSCRPIVMVHGLGGHPGNWTALEASLRLAGFGQVYRLDMRGIDSMRAGAKKLESLIEEVLTVNGISETGSVDVVAHSMGGVVVRKALAALSLRRRVHRVITLATPHRGSHLAWYLRRGIGAELSPNHQLWSELETQLPWAQEIPLTSFYADGDCLVLPAESCQVPGAENIRVENATHFSMLWSRDISRAITTRLLSSNSSQP